MSARILNISSTVNDQSSHTEEQECIIRRLLREPIQIGIIAGIILQAKAFHQYGICNECNLTGNQAIVLNFIQLVHQKHLTPSVNVIFGGCAAGVALGRFNLGFLVFGAFPVQTEDVPPSLLERDSVAHVD